MQDFTVTVRWWQEPDERPEGLPPLWVPQIVAPAGGAAVATRVVAGQGLLVAAEHPRDLQSVCEVHVGQDCHQFTQVPGSHSAAARLLVLQLSAHITRETTFMQHLISVSHGHRVAFST